MENGERTETGKERKEKRGERREEREERREKESGVRCTSVACGAPPCAPFVGAVGESLSRKENKRLANSKTADRKPCTSRRCCAC